MEIALRAGLLRSQVPSVPSDPQKLGFGGGPQGTGFPTEVAFSVSCFSLMPSTHVVWEMRTSQRSLALGSMGSTC